MNTCQYLIVTIYYNCYDYWDDYIVISVWIIIIIIK